MKKYIAILVNDLMMFKVVLDNLPDDIKQTTNFILFNETRIGNKVEDIKKVINNRINYKLFTTEDVNNKLYEIVHTEFVDEYSMSLNILMVWFCFKYNKKIDRILILDDDVIIRGSIDEIFVGQSKFKSDGLARLNLITGLKQGNKRSWLLKDEFDDIFETRTEYDDLYKTYCNGGTKFYVREEFDIERFEKYIKNFFESEIVRDIWGRRKTFRTAFLDERFEQLLNLDFEINNYDLDKYVRLINQNPDKIKVSTIAKSKKPLIHVCNHKWKEETIRRMKEEGVIK